MNTPNPTLMRQYGTEDVFLGKLAGSGALLERVGMGLLNYGLADSNAKSDVDAHAKQEVMDAAAREFALAKMELAASPLRHQHAPMFALADLPAGWDEGMVRMASIAAHTGVDLAKTAGIGDFFAGVVPAIKQFGQKALGAAPAATPLERGAGALKGKLGLGWKGNALLAAGALGTGVVANKAMHKATQVMGAESPAAPTYGPGRHGIQLAYGVNSYGQPQLGTSL